MEDSKFQRTLSLKNSIYLGVSSMIGAGLFNNLAPTSKISSYSTIYALLFASTLAIANASSSAQLAANFPQTGGTYLYAKHVLGKGYGALAGIVFIVGKTISCIAIALTLGNYLSIAYSKELAALFSIIVFLLGYFGIHKTVKLAKWLVLILFSILLFYSVSILTTQNLNLNIQLSQGFSFETFLLSSAIWFFSFTGYSRLATFGEEIQEPEKIIPKAIGIGLGITIFVYIVINWLTLSILNPNIIANVNTPLRLAMDVSSFSEFSFLIGFGSSIAMFSVFLALMPGISRIYVAMARDGFLPVSFSKIHSKNNSAYISEIVVLLFVLIGIYSLDVIPAIKLSSFFILIYYSITNLCVLKLSNNQRIYPKNIALYGFVVCILLAFVLLIYQ
ncbi:MAG: amino acid permease [Actinomycetota bacterium]|nr:amino acid permease [Actinomycetota bacterium]MDA3013845.1 amino acid permease [Actinomycetota bacterium]